MKKLFLLIFYLFLSKTLFSQTPTFYCPEIQQASSDTLREILKKYHAFQITAQSLHSFVSKTPSKVNFILQLGGQFSWDIELAPFDVRAEGYELWVQTPHGVERKKGANKTFRGQLKNIPDSEVRLTIDSNFVLGYVSIGTKTLFIEPLQRLVHGTSSQQYIIYDETDVIPDPGATCAATEVTELEAEIDWRSSQGAAGQCYTVEIAIASDYAMFQKFGSVAATENEVLAVLNNVQSNYDNEFADNIQFKLVKQFISSCASCDPWTSTNDPNTLLSSFGSWAAGANGFGVGFDIASMWSGRDFTGSTVGLAWLGAICSNFRYNVLQHFTSNASLLRVLMSHELGHNFNAQHDSGSGNIMAPSVNNTNTWSSSSINSINNYVSNLSNNSACLSACGGVSPAPAAAFSGSPTSGCPGVSVQFTDQSTGDISTRQWSFPGGTPSSSTAKNPLITYPNSGAFSVTLKVTGASGQDQEVKSAYININTAPVANYNFTPGSLQNSVVFQSTSTNATGFLWDFGDGTSSTQPNPTHTYAQEGTYKVKLTVNNNCGSNSIVKDVVVASLPVANFNATPTSGCAPLEVQFNNLSSANVKKWEWTFNGGSPATSTLPNPKVTFAQTGNYTVSLKVSNDQGEHSIRKENYINAAGTTPTAQFSYSNNTGQLTVTFTNTSINATSYEWDFGDGTSSTVKSPVHTYTQNGTYVVSLTARSNCGSHISTQTIVLNGQLPVADFSANPLKGCAPLAVQFTDQSAGNPKTWFWEFDGGTPSTSSEKNPLIVFANEGIFSVKLKVDNGNGQHQVVKQQLINVSGKAPSADFSVQIVSGDLLVKFTSLAGNASTYLWDFGDGTTSNLQNPTHSYKGAGKYQVKLMVTNSCGTNSIVREIELSTSPKADFKADVTSGCAPLEVQFTNLSTPSAGGTWQWVFKGGSPEVSTEAHPKVIFSSPGTYDVSLTYNMGASGADTKSMMGYIQISPASLAKFEYQVKGYEVTFVNNAANADNYHWDFGDGTASQEKNPKHAFQLDGKYLVTLKVTNACSSSSFSDSIAIFQGKPTAGFNLASRKVCQSVPVKFINESRGSIDSFTWYFPGGKPSLSHERSPVVVYDSLGVFDVTLVAHSDSGNATITRRRFVRVTPPIKPTYAAWTMRNLVLFSNTTTEADSVEWHFGDGTFSKEKNVWHGYPLPGEYRAKLITYSRCGKDSIGILVRVQRTLWNDWGGSPKWFSRDQRSRTASSQSAPIAENVPVNNEVFEGLKVWPNPNNGNFNLEFSGTTASPATIRVMDATGRVAHLQNIDTWKGINFHSFNLSGLPKGVYFLQVLYSEKIPTTRIVIE